MKNEIAKPQINIAGFSGSRALMPSTIDEAYRIAQAFSKSDFIPKEYRGQPDNCFTAINLGMEIGLAPMRSLQSIAVVNGKPCIYGDAQLALVRNSGLLEQITESYEGKEGADEFAAVCILKRKGDVELTIEKFTIADAKKAGLWGKTGPWTTHPKRMLRYKARAFALRDKFADVLLGLAHSVEEMQGEIIKDITPSKTAAAHFEQVPEIEFSEDLIDISLSLKKAVSYATSAKAVDKILQENQDLLSLKENDPEAFNEILAIAESKKASLSTQS